MLPTRACAQSPPPAYEIPRRLMPDCAQIPEPPGPLSVPPQLQTLLTDPPSLNFGCFLPTMTTELRATDSTTSMQNQVTTKGGDACQFNLHTIIDLPKFVVDPIHNPPCGFFSVGVSSTFGKFSKVDDGVTPPAVMPYVTASLNNYAVSAKALTVANTATQFSAKVSAGTYVIAGTVDTLCDHYVLRCTAPGISFDVTYPQIGISDGSHGSIDGFCPAQKSMVLALAGSNPGSIAFFNWIKLNDLGSARFDVFKVNGGGTRTKIGTTSLAASGVWGTTTYGQWCSVSLIPGLAIKIDAVVSTAQTTPGQCYDIALSVGDEFDVAVCLDPTQPCNRQLSLDFVFPAMLGDPRVQQNKYLLNAVFQNQREHHRLLRAKVVGGPIAPGETGYATVIDETGREVTS